MRIAIETRGLDVVTQRMARASAAMRGAPKTVRITFDDPSRNALIAKAQAANGRNPFFVSEPERVAVRQIQRQAIRDVRQVGDQGPWRAALESVGRRMVNAARRHIDLGLTKAKRGDATVTREAPLTPAYAKRKREAVGQKPILRFTDQMYRAIRYTVGR